MSKKSILALLVAIILPIGSYLVLKYFSENTAQTPRKMLLDDVVQYEEKGKMVNDSIWHKTGDLKLVNHLGDSFNLYQLAGKPIVIDFFFARCAGICPKLTKSMSKLQQSFKIGGKSRVKLDTTVVHFISITIDPENDSVAVLRDYAKNFGVNPDTWWLCTGDKKAIYDFAFNELKIDKFSEEEITPDFIHTSRFVLLDKNMIQRGRFSVPYSGLDSSSMKILARDIGLLMLEKDKTKKSAIFTKIIDLSWLWLIIALCVGGFVWYFGSKRKKEIN